ncbi:MAG: substrate-binding domain-containing protein [Planctomycetota bacterium]
MADDKAQSSGPRAVLWLLVLVAIAVSVVVYTRVAPQDDSVRIAFVTADNDPYWDSVIAGAEATAQQMGVELSIYRSSGELDDQNRLLSSITEAGYDGLALSPVDAIQQGIALRSIADAMPLITVDSDCDFSGRDCFIGPDNYTAGRLCGELLRDAAPDGAKIVIICGPVAKANGQLRRQGFIDEVLGRSFVPGRPNDALDAVLTEGGYTIVHTYVDELSPEQATANVAQALEEHPEATAVVGLFAYHIPAALAALETAGKTNDMIVVGFDDRQETLEAVADGRVFGTIAQDQFSYGLASVRMLADIARADEDAKYVAVPISGHVNFPPSKVTNATLEEFLSQRGKTRTYVNISAEDDA